MTQEYWMYFKENWQSMAEKEPAFEHVTMFQISPSIISQFRDECKQNKSPIRDHRRPRARKGRGGLFASRLLDCPLPT